MPSKPKRQSKLYINEAFIVLFVCSFFLFYKYIAQLFPSVISENLLTSYHFTGIELAIMASSYYYSYSILQIVSGYVIDRFDVRWPAFIAILLISIGMFLFSGTTNFYLMALSRILMGAGASLATVLYMKCAAVWCSKRVFGIVSSLLATFTMFGAAFGSAPIALLFAEVGWHQGLLMIAILGSIVALLALIFVTNKDAISEEAHKINLKDIKIVLSKKANWFLFIYAGITFSPIIIIGGLWGNPFLITKFHISNSMASMLMFVMFIGVGIGAPIWAVISSILNRRKSLMHIANLFAILSLGAIIYLNIPYHMALILFFILGFAVGCFMISFQLCRELNPVFIMGLAVAFVNMGDGIISSIIEPLIGHILDSLKTGSHFSLESYHIALAILPFCFLISSLSLLFIKTKE